MFISIVIPLYNEEQSLESLLAKINETMVGMNSDYEVIFVDDGSTDSSFEVLKKLQEKGNKIKVLQFRRNYGKAAALSAGFQEAKGDLIITMDADLQDDPQEIPKLITKLDEGCDLVSGWKKKRYDPLSKTIPSTIFNKITSLVSGIKIHDFNCGLKAYRREVTEDIKIYGDLHRYLPVLAHWQGYRIGEIEVHHHPRKYGRSKYGAKRFVNGLLDLITIILITRYTFKPLHFFGTIGILLETIGIIIGVYILALRIQYGNIQGRNPLLMLGILLMILGIQFVSTGLLGEMITRSQQERETGYTVKKKL